eukprot:3337085-Prymnesium_polylepis.1
MSCIETGYPPGLQMRVRIASEAKLTRRCLLALSAISAVASTYSEATTDDATVVSCAACRPRRATAVSGGGCESPKVVSRGERISSSLWGCQTHPRPLAHVPHDQRTHFM